MERCEILELARQIRDCVRCERCSECPRGGECAIWYKMEYAVGVKNKHGQMIAALMDYIDELEGNKHGKGSEAGF